MAAGVVAADIFVVIIPYENKCAAWRPVAPAYGCNHQSTGIDAFRDTFKIIRLYELREAKMLGHLFEVGPTGARVVCTATPLQGEIRHLDRRDVRIDECGHQVGSNGWAAARITDSLMFVVGGVWIIAPPRIYLQVINGLDFHDCTPI